MSCAGQKQALARPLWTTDKEGVATEVVAIGLGSNLGDSAEIIRAALQSLHTHPQLCLLAHSSLYLSRPLNMQSRNWFVNAAALVRTPLPPQALMRTLQRIELAYGRVRTAATGQRIYQDRMLDLDILLYGDQVIQEEELSIPHPRMLERLFVLKPLAEIVGELHHPLMKRKIYLLARYLQKKALEQTVVRLDAGDNQTFSLTAAGRLMEANLRPL